MKKPKEWNMANNGIVSFLQKSTHACFRPNREEIDNLLLYPFLAINELKRENIEKDMSRLHVT